MTKLRNGKHGKIVRGNVTIQGTLEATAWHIPDEGDSYIEVRVDNGGGLVRFPHPAWDWIEDLEPNEIKPGTKFVGVDKNRRLYMITMLLGTSDLYWVDLSTSLMGKLSDADRRMFADPKIYKVVQ